MSRRALCRLEDLEDPGSAAVILELADGPCPILLVRRGRTVFAYKNSCPHIGAPLDWMPGRFLDAGRQFILCASHGASFRVEDGFCLGGPCAGKSLDAVPVSLEDGVVWG